MPIDLRKSVPKEASNIALYVYQFIRYIIGMYIRILNVRENIFNNLFFFLFYQINLDEYSLLFEKSISNCIPADNYRCNWLPGAKHVLYKTIYACTVQLHVQLQVCVLDEERDGEKKRGRKRKKRERGEISFRSRTCSLSYIRLN